MVSTRPGPVRVLVLTDQRLLAELVKFTLIHGGYLTRDAQDAAEALALVRTGQPQIVIPDIDRDGARLLAELRAPERGGSRLPVLALTRRGDLKTKLAAFDQGVDDIMTIPFAPDELVARILALSRRSLGQSVALNPVLRVGEMEIDILNRRVRAGTSELHLTGLEQSLLYVLAANAGRVVTRDEILDALWGTDFVAESNVVDRHVRGLRVKLQNDWRKPRFIATVPGRGYRFVPTFTDQETAS